MAALLGSDGRELFDQRFGLSGFGCDIKIAEKPLLVELDIEFTFTRGEPSFGKMEPHGARTLLDRDAVGARSAPFGLINGKGSSIGDLCVYRIFARSRLAAVIVAVTDEFFGRWRWTEA